MYLNPFGSSSCSSYATFVELHISFCFTWGKYTTNEPKWKVSKVKLWPKPDIRNSAYTKPRHKIIGPGIITQLSCLRFLLKTREKLCIWKMKKKCWRRFDRVMVTNLFAQTILDKIFGGNKMISSKIGQD